MDYFILYIILIMSIIRCYKISDGLSDAIKDNEDLERKIAFILDECGQKAVEASERWERLNRPKNQSNAGLA